MDELLSDGWWSQEDAFSVLDAMSADPLTRSKALPPDEGAWWWMTHGGGRDSDARELQISRLRSGLDLLVVDERGPALGSTRPPVEPAPRLSELVELRARAQPPMVPVTTFIEILVMDEDGNPIADEPYELELPDGQLRSGVLDAGGFARVDGIPIGPCTVRFPRCHRDEIEAA